MITDNQVEFYRENGYVIVNDVLSESECSNYMAQIRKHANKDFAAIMNPDRPEFLVAQSFVNLPDSTPLGEKVDFIEMCKVTSQMTWDIAAHPNAVKILEMIQKDRVSYLMSQMLFKEANSAYAPQAWAPHQDNAYPRNENFGHRNGFTTQYITTNFFMEGADASNGTLYVYPGSHKEGLFDAAQRVSYREEKGSNPGNEISQEVLSRFKKVDCVFKKGDMLVLNGNCIHGSYPNESKTKSRPLLSVSYITAGEKFISGTNARRTEKSLR